MQGGNSPSSYVAQRSYGRCGGWVHGSMNLYLPLGAFKSQLGETYILSLLFYTVNVYCDFTYIYYIVTFHSSCLFIVDVFARPMHVTSEFAMTVLSKCVQTLKIGFVATNIPGS